MRPAVCSSPGLIAPRSIIAAVGACVVLAGCSGPVDGTPAVHIVEAAKPSASLPAEQVLPNADELAVILGTNGFMGQLVTGGADMLLQGVGETEATPVECVSATYRLQKVVYQASRVQSVASRSWAGGDLIGPSLSGFFGVVKFATPDDAQAFFASSAEKWRRCNGQTMVLHQPEHGADGLSRITDVVIEPRIVSAIVIQEASGSGSPPIQRALGVASDCVVDVDITDVGGAGGAKSAVGVANLMLNKIGVS
jgi:PknH-like extracellular domain